MSDPNSQNASTPVVLTYETAAAIEPGKRPGWVYAVLAIYGIGAVALLTAPVWGSLLAGENDVLPAGITVACVTLCGLSLMILPVRVVRRRRIAHRSIWIPILASGLLAGALMAGAIMAWCEYQKFFDEPSTYASAIGGCVVWLIWSIVFAWIAFAREPQSIGMKLHRTLIAGSVLELLVAVPTHIVVRRRPDCCAGMMTGTAICIGVIVMFVAFGPSVLLLYYQRQKRISRAPRESA